MRWYQRCFRRETSEKQLDAELRFHLDQRIADLGATGMDPQEARRRARLEFGGLDQVKEGCRDVGAARFLETLIQDVRYGLRMLRQNPGFTAVAVLTLALGIGANTAIFSVFDALLLRPLPVSKPGELVELWTVVPNHEHDIFSYPMASELARNSKSFSSVAPWGGPVVPLEVKGESAPGNVSLVTEDYFRTLGVRPSIGRLFGPEDFKAGAGGSGTAALIAYEFWRARYGGKTDVLGKTLKVNGHPYTIVGVTPKGFFGAMVGISDDVWVPLGPPLTPAEQLRNPESQGYWLTARLRPGVSVAKARAEVEALWPGILQSIVPARLNGEQRERFLKQRIRIEPAEAGFAATSLLQFERPLRVLMTGVCLLLLIACVNLASLLAARAANRAHEMGIRVALGAGRWRLTGQVITEGAILSVSGALLGFPLAYVASGALARFVWTGWFPAVLNFRPDWRILLFTGALALLTCILFSLLPAWQAQRQEPANFIRGGAGAPARSSGVWKVGKVLIGAQVGLSLVLMEGASLFTRNLAGLRSLDLGFEPDKVLGLLLQPKPGAHKNVDAPAYYRNLIDDLARLPGVRSVSLSGSEPIWRVNFRWTRPVSLDSGEASAGSSVEADEHWVSPNFFRTMGIRVLEGREFSFQDDRQAPPVVIISRSLAQRFFPTGEALGRSITVTSESGNLRLRVVGVVNDANLFFVRNQKPLAVYLPFLQRPNPISAYVEIRTYGEPGTVFEESRRQVEASGREYVFLSETLTQAVNRSLTNDRVLAMLSDVFAGLALAMVAIGLFGQISYSVARRTSEIGVRMALGAETANIMRLILSGSLRLIAIGVAAGLPVALAISRLVSKLLFNLSPGDPVSLAVAVATVAGVALLAVYFPARRATKVDPMIALRYE